MALCRAGLHEKTQENTILNRDGSYRRCRECARESSKLWHKRAREEGRISKVNKDPITYRSYSSFRNRQIKQKWVNFLGGSCVLCGYKETLEALDFDHINPETKEKDISILLFSGASDDEKRKELAKCQLLCANCHRAKTKRDYINDSHITLNYLSKGALIEVLYTIPFFDPTGDPTKARVSYRTYYGIFEGYTEGHEAIVLTTTVDKDVDGQNGWICLPIGGIHTLRLIRKTPARPRKAAGKGIINGTITIPTA